MAQQLAGKSALITGASRGIGAATAIAFAQQGASRLYLHYGSYEQGAREVQEKVKDLGADCELFQADLGTELGIKGFAGAIGELEVDILVNNAGSLVQRAKLPEYTYELYNRVMDLNTKSVYFISQAIAPGMIARKSGVIINVSSIAARNGGGLGATIYASAKAAVAAMTKGMAKELAPSGIRVNAVSPGTVDNYFHQQFSTKQMLDMMTAQTVVGKLGTNEEVADLIVFLSTPQSSYIIGQTIEINGGMFMI